MTSTLRPAQIIQLQSFWNLIQATDVGVQKELLILLQRKYGREPALDSKQARASFLQMKGILKGSGSQESDQQMLDDYFKEKYGL